MKTDLHIDFLEEFERIQSALRDERLQCLQDRRFCWIAGAQWEGPLGVQFENKPRFEMNKIQLSVVRIYNEYCNNRSSVSFISKAGQDKHELADACADLYRACEQDSSAEEAYDSAFMEAISGGFGAWRLYTEYEDEEDCEDERQKILIAPIPDADVSVFFDLDAKRQDKADARRCYILHTLTIEEYKRKYDDDPASWPQMIHQLQFDWLTPPIVRIAEIYDKEEVSDTVYVFQDLDGTEKRVMQEDYAEKKTELLAMGFKELRKKKIKTHKVHKYLASGGGILEDCGYIAGKNIPVVPVYGKRFFIENVERCMGHVRTSRDAQRLKNMQESKLAEIASLSAVERPIFIPDQIGGHQDMWSREHIDNYPYLLINPLIDQNGNVQVVGPAAYTHPPQVPPAMAALLGMTEQDIKDLLGNQSSGESVQTQMSGRAVELVQNRLDMQTFIYVSNMSKAIRRSGEIWLGMAQDVYVEPGRNLRGITKSGDYQTLEIKKPTVNNENLEIIYENNLEDADFDVVSVVGPSSQSKRQSTVRALTNVMQFIQDPETIQVLGSMIIMNMEGEGIEDVQNFFRQKLIKIGVTKPSEEEAKELQQKQPDAPDPQTQFLLASSQQAQAMAQKAQADTALAMAKAKETEVKTELTIKNAMELQQGLS